MYISFFVYSFINYTVLIFTPFNKKSDIWLATISATTIEASVVDAAICGVNTAFGLLNKTFSLAGSFEKNTRPKSFDQIW